MDRARDSTILWNNSADRFLDKDTRWVFEPSEIVKRSFTELGELLSNSGVSQRHTQDTGAWRAIGEVLNDYDRSPQVYNVTYGGRGDARELLAALALRIGPNHRWPVFPNLGGLKIGPMWIRMLVSPGGAHLINLQELRVAVDIQVHRVTYSLGLTDKRPRTDDINKKLSLQIQRALQRDVKDAVAPSMCKTLDGTAGALDPALWFIGKWGCSFCEQRDEKVPIAEFCRRCRLSSTNMPESRGNADQDLERNDARMELGTSDRTSVEEDAVRDLSPLEKEHFNIAKLAADERSGASFSAREFKELYRMRYPSRPPTSIMPAGYSVPSADSDMHRPKFLQRTDDSYVFTGPPKWLS